MGLQNIKEPLGLVSNGHLDRHYGLRRYADHSRANEKITHPLSALFWNAKSYWMTPCSIPKNTIRFISITQDTETHYNRCAIQAFWEQTVNESLLGFGIWTRGKFEITTAPLHHGAFSGHGLGAGHQRQNNAKTPFCDATTELHALANHKTSCFGGGVFIGEFEFDWRVQS